jgi:hypothetical protein
LLRAAPAAPIADNFVPRRPPRYHARVIQRLGRRALEALVALFALLGFAFVPLGQRTALEHAKSILSTQAAAEAGRELLQAGVKLRQRLLEVAQRPKAVPNDEPAKESPTPDEGALALPTYVDAGAGGDASQPYSPGT